MGGVMHLLLLKWKSTLNSVELCSLVLALKDICLHPETKRPYIVNITGGKDNSPEGFQKGITHAFVIEFASIADRDYYVTKDPAHARAGKALLEGSEDVIVVDYEVGVF